MPVLQRERPPLVAIINTNPDMVELLKVALEAAGLVVVVVHVADIRSAAFDLDVFVRQHDPKVIIYDVAPPYDRQWRVMEHVRTSPFFEGRHFVLTTVNTKALHKVVGTDETVYEIVGQNEDISRVVSVVKEATRARAILRGSG